MEAARSGAPSCRNFLYASTISHSGRMRAGLATKTRQVPDPGPLEPVQIDALFIRALDTSGPACQVGRAVRRTRPRADHVRDHDPPARAPRAEGFGQGAG